MKSSVNLDKLPTNSRNVRFFGGSCLFFLDDFKGASAASPLGCTVNDPLSSRSRTERRFQDSRPNSYCVLNNLRQEGYGEGRGGGRISEISSKKRPEARKVPGLFLT